MGKLQQFTEAAGGLTATGESRRRLVTVTRSPDGHVDVRIDPRWYRSVTERDFRDEVVSAIHDALTDFGEQRARLFREHFRPHLDREENR